MGDSFTSRLWSTEPCHLKMDVYTSALLSKFFPSSLSTFSQLAQFYTEVLHKHTSESAYQKDHLLHPYLYDNPYTLTHSQVPHTHRKKYEVYRGVYYMQVFFEKQMSIFTC